MHSSANCPNSAVMQVARLTGLYVLICGARRTPPQEIAPRQSSGTLQIWGVVPTAGSEALGPVDLVEKVQHALVRLQVEPEVLVGGGWTELKRRA